MERCRGSRCRSPPPQPSLPQAVRSKAPAPDGRGGPEKGGGGGGGRTHDTTHNCKVGLWLPESAVRALGVLAESWGPPGAAPP